HYVVRAWPWVLAGLAALVVFPDLDDPELGYPLLMLEYLPTGLLGLVVASFLAAFMSTVSTQINWGASYLVNDLYARFVDDEADDATLVALGRVASVVIVAIAGTAAFYADDIGTVFRFMIAIGTRPGAVLILRWFWWRVNAWAELSAMVAGFLIGALSYLPLWGELEFGLRLAVTAGGAAAVWLPVMLLTAPEDEDTLASFYRRARPGGPGWRRVRDRLGIPAERPLGRDLAMTLAAGLLLLSGIVGVGGTVLLERSTAVPAGLVAVASLAWLIRLHRAERAEGRRTG
ncbi:MAG: sodium:solute symporter family transporter, partial [Gemmatimonadota bacterium]